MVSISWQKWELTHFLRMIPLPLTNPTSFFLIQAVVSHGLNAKAVKIPPPIPVSLCLNLPFLTLIPPLSSFHPLPCGKHPLCLPGKCNNSTCSYDMVYGDGTTSSKGILGSDKYGSQTIKNLVFGCGIDNRNFPSKSFDPENQRAGVLGMVREESSFVNQISTLVQGRFSYCLPRNVRSGIFFRFGEDIPNRPYFNSTSLLPHLGTEQFTHYSLPLTGISIARKWLPNPREIFSEKIDGAGGCVIDSGTTFSHIALKAYDAMKQSLERVFSSSSVRRIKGQVGLDLCYERLDGTKGLKDLHMVAFHMECADFLVQAQAAFYIGELTTGNSFFCLAMLPSNSELTIIGSFQQANQRFVFDTIEQKMYFGPEDCRLSM